MVCLGGGAHCGGGVLHFRLRVPLRRLFVVLLKLLVAGALSHEG